MTTMNGSAPTVDRTRGVATPEDYSRYVRRTFSRTMRGYSPAEVDAHLQVVEGWFTLAGFERLLEERREELLGAALREAEATAERAQGQAEATAEHARREAEATAERAQRQAEATAERAQREAEAILDRARRESETILADATRREEALAAAERRFAAIKKLASEILEQELDGTA